MKTTEMTAKLRKRIAKKGWTQGALENETGSCLIGHLRHLVPPKDRKEDTPYAELLASILSRHPLTELEMVRARVTLMNVLGPNYTPLQLQEVLVGFINDKRCMELDDILALLRLPENDPR